MISNGFSIFSWTEKVIKLANAIFTREKNERILCYSPPSSPPSNLRGVCAENVSFFAGMSSNHLFVLYYLIVLVYTKITIHLSVGGR